MIKKGFTLIELMVVIAVIAVLATMVLFGLGKAQAAARDAGRQQMMTGIQGALASYYGDNQMYWTPDATQNNVGDFCSLTAVLFTSNYISAQPVDPATKAAICGSGNMVVPVNGVNVQYDYTVFTGGTGYQLTLVKESGGMSKFISPQ